MLINGTPEYLRSDNGPEFIAKKLRKWLSELGVITAYIEPGSPWENGYCESFNSRMRDEFLNGELFGNMYEAQVLTARWVRYYNEVRPHSSLGGRPPAPQSHIPRHKLSASPCLAPCVADKYHFVDTHFRCHAVGKLCRALGISRSGYYAWKTRKPGKREQSNQQLSRTILGLHQKHPALGLDSIYHMLHRDHRCSRGRVHRLMKRLDVHSVRKKAFRNTTNSNHKHPVAPNRLNRDFHVSVPGQVWVGDITYIPTGNSSRIFTLPRA